MRGRNRNIYYGFLTASVISIVLLQLALIKNIQPEPESTGSKPTVQFDSAPSVVEGGIENGFVFANDESPESKPFSITRTEKSNPTFFAAIKKAPVIRKGMGNATSFTVNDAVYPLHTYQMLAAPNDPQANQAWVRNASLDTSWDIPDGSQQTTLAIIDTGFALSHEEFAGRWLENTLEKGSTGVEEASRLNCTAKGLTLDYSCNLVDDNVDGIIDNEAGSAPYENRSFLNCTDQGKPRDKSCNRIDDDSNGYIDDVTGWDIINQDNSVQAGELSPSGEGTTHGSLVTGVAAATGNNAKGIAGVDWKTKVLPIQALDDDGYGNTRSVGEAIRYAVKRNVDVINLSLGSEFQDEYVREAVELATAAGILVVAAAGNDGCDCVLYPARYPEVLSVGALDAINNKASFSSWGSTLDIMAPGTNFTSPTWVNSNGSSAYATGVNGTSFASPLVAGLATVIKSHQPNAKPLHIISAMRQTVSKSGLNGAIKNDMLGYGKANANSLRARMVTPRNLSQAYVFQPVTAGNYFTSNNFETSGSYSIESCEGSTPSMPFYEMKKNGDLFYTMSEVELRRATILGYTVSTFGYGCLRQPHDTANNIRLINIFSEFKNIYRKI